MNLKLFCNHGGIYRFEKKFNKCSGEINSLGLHEDMRGCLLEVNSEGLGWYRQCVLQSFWREPETFFEKEGAVENSGVYFKIRDIGTLVLGDIGTFVSEIEENFMRNLSASLFNFFWSSLDVCTFITLLLNLFDWPSYSSKSKKRDTLRL